MYSFQQNSTETHKVAMTISNSRNNVLVNEDFASGGIVRKYPIPLNDNYEVCFDGR